MQRPKKIEAEKVIGTKFERKKFTLTDKDAILYALGIGFSQDPMREQDYKYTNQLHEQFTTFPMFGCVAGVFDTLSVLLSHPHMPEFSPFIILHAEQKTAMIAERIQTGIEYEIQAEIIDVVDKGKNALICYRLNTYQKVDGKDVLVYYNHHNLILRGFGGFGFKGKGLPSFIPKVPESAPSVVLKASTYPNQAFIYRLSGDINPLHVDPNISAIQNFEKPIIHGLATYGVVSRAISQQLLDNDQTRIKSFSSRFIGHVFPGETFDIALWKADNKFIFLVTVVERKTKVLIGELQYKPGAKM